MTAGPPEESAPHHSASHQRASHQSASHQSAPERRYPTLLEQMGGVSGIVASTIPVAVFVVVNIFAELRTALIAYGSAMTGPLALALHVALGHRAWPRDCGIAVDVGMRVVAATVGSLLNYRGLRRRRPQAQRTALGALARGGRMPLPGLRRHVAAGVVSRR